MDTANTNDANQEQRLNKAGAVDPDALRGTGELEIRQNEGPRGTNRYRIVLPGLDGTKPHVAQSARQQPLKPASSPPPEAQFTPEEPFTLKPVADTPEAGFLEPLKPTSDEPSMNHHEPPRVAKSLRFELPAWVPTDAWEAWLEMRKKAKKAPTDRAKALVVKTLDQLKKEGFDPGDVLDQSTRNNWTDVFPLKRPGNITRPFHASSQLSSDEQLLPEAVR